MDTAHALTSLLLPIHVINYDDSVGGNKYAVDQSHGTERMGE